ncbi:MAG: ATP-binding protein [Bacteroidales bacterium]|nr:ATP-binding protein [Bacteroidales bacterium]
MEVERCAVCGEPLYKEMIWFGTPKMQRRMCACRRKEVEEEEARDEALKMFSRIRNILDEGYLDQVYAKYTFASADSKESKIFKSLKAYADEFAKAKANNMGLFLYGTPGVGKTFYASCIANEVRNQGEYVLIGSAADLIRYFTKDYGRNEEAERKIRTYPLMVIDDIGVEKTNDGTMSVMNDIIDIRYRSRKPLICTSNFTLDKLYEGTGAYGERITSRLSESCVQFRITGKDRRKNGGTT